jgi:hypothetical protein
MAPPSVVRVEKYPTVNQVPPYSGVFTLEQVVQFWWQPPLDDGGYPIVAYYINVIVEDQDVGAFYAVDPNERIFTFQNADVVRPGYSVYAEMFCLNDNGEFSPVATTLSVPYKPIPATPSFQLATMTSPTSCLTSAVTELSLYDRRPNVNFITQIQNPTTSNISEYAAPWANSNSNVAGYLRPISNLTEAWYRYTIRAYNLVDYNQPGLFDAYPFWSYLKYPYRYNEANSLQIWLDAQQQPYFLTYPQDNRIHQFSNFAFQQYTFYGTADVSVSDSSQSAAFTCTANTDYLISSPQITVDNQLTNQNFTLLYVGVQNTISAPDSIFQSRFTPTQIIGYGPYSGNSGKICCQMDETEFVPALEAADGGTDIYTVSRDGTTGFVTFRYNGSTISTSGTSLATLNDIAFCGSNSIGGNQSGELKELMYYNSNLPLAARETLEGYLARKWGLVANLPSNHPYKYVGP